MREIQTYDAHRRSVFYAKSDITSSAVACLSLVQKKQALADLLPMVNKIVLYHWKNKVIHIEPVNGGTFHYLFKVYFDSVHTQYPDIYVRISRLPYDYKNFTFLIDAFIYKTLAHAGLQENIFIDYDISRTTFSVDYSIIKAVHGSTLDHFQDSKTQYMNPVLLQNLGAWVAKLHTITTCGFGSFAITTLIDNATLRGIHQSWKDYLYCNLKQHISICFHNNVINQHEALLIESIFKKMNFVIPQGVLLHSDLGNHNIISSDGQTIAGVIDWEDCISGDPIFDIAFWGTFFKDEMLYNFMAGYTPNTVLHDSFFITYWIYYLRIALAKTVHRSIFGYQDRQGMPKASLRIQKSLWYLKKLGVI